MTEKVSMDVVNLVFDGFADALKKGDRIEIRGFGSFVVMEYEAYTGRNPINVSLITNGLSNAPIKKQIMVNGGANPSGDACAAMHWHGFIGMEREAVDIISNLIKNPKA